MKILKSLITNDRQAANISGATSLSPGFVKGLAVVFAVVWLVIGSPLISLAEAVPWEKDLFDDLPLGTLNGKNGWSGTPSAQIINELDCRGLGSTNKILLIDPAAGKTIKMGKDVADQNSNRHVLEMRVKVSGAVDPTLAKLEVRTTLNNGWDKKYQIYFGGNIRINYGPSASQKVFLVATTEMDRWYRIRVVMDLDSTINKFDAYVDGVKVVSDQTMHTGKLVSLALSGWDRPGAVYWDELYGVLYHSSPRVKVTSPTPGSPVSGVVPITVSTTNATKVEFYIDDILHYTDTASPFTFNWDTTANPVPDPNHQIDYAYYGVVGVVGDNNDHFDYMSEVEYFTNYFLIGRAAYKYDTNWQNMMAADMANGASYFENIELALDLNNTTYTSEPNHLSNVLDTAAPYWYKIARIEIAGEPTWDLTTTNSKLTEVRNALSTKGLDSRPLGITYPANSLPTWLSSTTMNWVGIEAYITAPGSPISQTNIDNLITQVTNDINKVPTNMDISLVMMAFNRNNVWTNIDTLRDLQIPTYLMAYANSRVVSIRMFAYNRICQGVRQFPELLTPHKLIGEKIMNLNLIPPAGNGQRTIKVKAYNSTGAAAIDTAMVDVSN
jgi:hypothetical protein